MSAGATLGVALILGSGVLLILVGLAQSRAARRRRIGEALDLALTDAVTPTASLALAFERTIKWTERRTEGTPWRST